MSVATRVRSRFVSPYNPLPIRPLSPSAMGAELHRRQGRCHACSRAPKTKPEHPFGFCTLQELGALFVLVLVHASVFLFKTEPRPPPEHDAGEAPATPRPPRGCSVMRMCAGVILV